MSKEAIKERLEDLDQKIEQESDSVEQIKLISQRLDTLCSLVETQAREVTETHE